MLTTVARFESLFRFLGIFIATPLFLSACSSGGGSSTETAVGSDEEIRIEIFSDLPIKGATLIQNGNQVEDIVQIDGNTSTISIFLGDLELNSATSIAAAELAQIKFRDLFLEALPSDADALLRETGTLNDVTDFDRFANALLLLVTLDQDANLANGIDLSHLNFDLIEGMDLNLDVPNSRFLEEPSVRMLITALDGTFAVDPYLAISDYYELNDLAFTSKQILKVKTTTANGEFSSSYRFTIDGNLKTIEHAELDSNGLLIPIADETFDWNNPSQLDSQIVSAGPTTVFASYDYDAQGRLTSESKTSPEQQSTSLYNYSTAGLLQSIETTETTSQYTAVVLAEREYTNGRHSKTRRTRTHSLYPDSASGANTQVETLTFTYDEFGNQTTVESDFANDGSIDQRIIYSRDASGNIDSQEVSQRLSPSAELSLLSVESFNHNDRGQIIEYKFDSNADGLNELKNEYRYNQDGYLAESITTRFDASGEVLSTQTSTYEYTVRDESGDIRNLISPPQVRVPVGFQP